MVYLVLKMKVEKQIRAAVDILKKGGVVAFPTDTVYGLGASAGIGQGVERVYQVKRRSHSSPLPVLLADITQLAIVVHPVTPLIQCLVRHFLPGGLTIIGRKTPSVLDIITAGSNTVAVRIPDHPVPIALIRGLGTPIIGTSANVSGEPSVTTAEEVRRQIGDNVDFIINDGIGCLEGVESTVVDVTAGAIEVLREGVIPVKEIMEACASVSGGER